MQLAQVRADLLDVGLVGFQLGAALGIEQGADLAVEVVAEPAQARLAFAGLLFQVLPLGGLRQAVAASRSSAGRLRKPLSSRICWKVLPATSRRWSPAGLSRWPRYRRFNSSWASSSWRRSEACSSSSSAALARRSALANQGWRSLAGSASQSSTLSWGMCRRCLSTSNIAW